MLIARVAYGVKDHFLSRWFEWVLAAMILNFGWTLLRPGATFDTSHSFDVMARFANEITWGICLTLIGGLRLTALVINGSIERFKVASPYVRSACSGLSVFVWLSISLGVYASGQPVPGGGTYFGIMIAEIIVCWIVAQQAGAAELTYREEKASGNGRGGI